MEIGRKEIWAVKSTLGYDFPFTSLDAEGINFSLPQHIQAFA
jgi:hypothetical protein